jgi:hypothetical protein
MTEAVLQRKLNQLAKLANELDDEAKARYGDKGFLFFESDGAFHLMDGDAPGKDDGSAARQRHIVASSKGYCRMSGGAW